MISGELLSGQNTGSRSYYSAFDDAEISYCNSERKFRASRTESGGKKPGKQKERLGKKEKEKIIDTNMCDSGLPVFAAGRLFI